MKKVLFLLTSIIFIFTFFSLISQNCLALPNPWTDCEDDIGCAIKQAGFNFPLRIKNYSVRAMKDMIEIKFPLDKKRTVTLRKSISYAGDDISGVWTNYPINKTIKLKNGVIFNVRGNKKKYYVASFAAETGYYSIYCANGLKENDINYLYALIAEAEAPPIVSTEKSQLTLEQLRNSRTVDGIVEPVFTQDCFPKTLSKRGVTKDCFERANLNDTSFCSESQIKMIREYYKKGQKCDPLNSESGDFCAE